MSPWEAQALDGRRGPETEFAMLGWQQEMQIRRVVWPKAIAEREKLTEVRATSRRPLHDTARPMRGPRDLDVG